MGRAVGTGGGDKCNALDLTISYLMLILLASVYAHVWKLIIIGVMMAKHDDVKVWLLDNYEFEDEAAIEVCKHLISGDAVELAKLFEGETPEEIETWVFELTTEYGKAFPVVSSKPRPVADPLAELPDAVPDPKAVALEADETGAETEDEPEAETEAGEEDGAEPLAVPAPPKYPPAHGMGKKQIQTLKDMIESEAANPFIPTDSDSGGVKLSNNRSVLINLLARPGRICEVVDGLVETKSGRIHWGHKVVVNVEAAQAVIDDYETRRATPQVPAE